MADYRLSTIWRIEAPIEDVYRTVRDSGQWPQWWQGVERVVELEPGDDSGVGCIQRHTWKGLLPYRLDFELRVTRVDPERALEGVVSGELEGVGRWSFVAENPGTTVRHDWQVRTTTRWLNLLAPIARPLFEWNHAAVMRRGARGLAVRLGARLLPAVDRDRGVARDFAIDGRAALWAGIAAGIVSTFAQMLAWWGSGDAVIAQLLRDTRMTAAIVIGAAVLPPPASFDPLLMVLATAVHFTLSVAYAAMLGWAIGRPRKAANAMTGPMTGVPGPMTAATVGLLFGLALYLVNLHGFTWVFPWFVAVRGWDTLLAHLVFGVVAALVYRARATPR